MDKLRLICAEDDEFMKELLMETLKMAIEDEEMPEMDIVYVENAEKLRAALHQAFADAVPFIILSDEHMPDGTGSAVIAEFIGDEKYQDVDWDTRLLDLAIISGTTPFDDKGDFAISFLSKTQKDLFVILQGMRRELKFIAKPTPPDILIEFLNGAGKGA